MNKEISFIGSVATGNWTFQSAPDCGFIYKETLIMCYPARYNDLRAALKAIVAKFRTTQIPQELFKFLDDLLEEGKKQPEYHSVSRDSKSMGFLSPTRFFIAGGVNHPDRIKEWKENLLSDKEGEW